MAKTPVVVTEDDYKADPENVQRIETQIPGFADADPIVTYVKVQHIDDVTGKPATDGIECVPLLIPVEKEKEVPELDAEGDPVLNDDGSEKIKTEKYWDYEPMEIDLSAASLKKLLTALKPFAEKCRERVVSVPSSRPAVSATGSPNPELTAWNRRAKEWLRNAGHDVKEKGRLAEDKAALYAKNNPQDPKPV